MMGSILAVTLLVGAIYDKLPTQDLAPEVLETVCSWLGATLRQAPPLSPGQGCARR